MKQKLEYKSFDFEVSETKEIDREGQKFGIVIGFLATFGGDKFDRGNDTFQFGAFTDSINEHKARNNRPIRMLFQHTRSEVIGGFPISLVEQTEKGLLVTGEINLDVQKGREVYALTKQGVITDMSIGFSVNEELTDDEGRRTITRAAIWEGSMVDEPMDMGATITDVKSFDIEQVQEVKTKRDFEKLMRDVGFSQKAAKYLASNYSEQRDDVGEKEAEELKRLEADKAAIEVKTLAAIREAIASFK